MYSQTVTSTLTGGELTWSATVTVHITFPKVFVPILWRVNVTSETHALIQACAEKLQCCQKGFDLFIASYRKRLIVVVAAKGALTTY